MKMTSDEFNALLNGPLHHPFPMFTLTRLSIALRAVVDATGEAGATALRQHCQERQESDERKMEPTQPGPGDRLLFNHESKRWAIGDYDLHCGDCFQVFIGETWHDVRIEHSQSAGGWYLVGLPKHYSSKLDAYRARRGS